MDLEKLKSVFEGLKKVILEALNDESFERSEIAKAINENWSSFMENKMETIISGLVAEGVKEKVEEAKKILVEENDKKIGETIDQLTGDLKVQFDEAVSSIKSELQDQFVTESRNEIITDLYESIKKLIIEKNLEFDQDAHDQVKLEESDHKKTKDKLDKVINENIELKKMVNKQNRSTVFESFCSGKNFSDVQKDRLKFLSESIQFDEKYKDRLSVFSESFLDNEPKEDKKSKPENPVKKLIDEGADIEVVDPLDIGVPIVENSETDSKEESGIDL